MLLRSRRAALGLSLAATATFTAPPLTGTATAAPVAGYISIVMRVGMTSPQVLLSGVFTTWNCSQSTWPPVPANSPFTVSCFPVGPPTTTWECSVLHADIRTLDLTGVARTAMWCDDKLSAVTRTVRGTNDSDRAFGTGATQLKHSFRCMIDNGAAGTPQPSFHGFCGDPPLLDLVVG